MQMMKYLFHNGQLYVLCVSHNTRKRLVTVTAYYEK